MKHVDAFETTALPGDLGRGFAADAPSVAVLVEAGRGGGGESERESPGESEGPTGGPPTGRRDAAGDGSPRRASVTVYRVGDGYVLDCTDASGAIDVVGMGPGQLEAYVDRVREDDEWTVLSIADQGTGTRREPLEGESPPSR